MNLSPHVFMEFVSHTFSCKHQSFSCHHHLTQVRGTGSKVYLRLWPWCPDGCWDRQGTLASFCGKGLGNPKPQKVIQTKTQNTTNRNHVSIFISTCLHVTRLWLLIFHRSKSFSGSGRLLNFPGYQPYLKVWPSQIVARFWTLGQLCVSEQAHTTPWTRHDNYVPQDSSRTLRKLPDWNPRSSNSRWNPRSSNSRWTPRSSNSRWTPKLFKPTWHVTILSCKGVSCDPEAISQTLLSNYIIGS